MPPSACGVGTGAPWRATPGAPSLPPPPFLAELVGAWWWESGVSTSGALVTSWQSYASADPGGYALGASGSPTMGAAGVEVSAGDLVIGSIVMTGAGPGQALVVSYERDAAEQAAAPQSTIARLVLPSGQGTVGAYYPATLRTPGGFWFEAGGAPQAYLSPAVADDGGEGIVGVSIDDAAANIRRVRWLRDGAGGAEFGDASGVVLSLTPAAGATFRLGDTVGGLGVTASIRGAWLYRRGLNQAELDAVIAYAGGL